MCVCVGGDSVCSSKTHATHLKLCTCLSKDGLSSALGLENITVCTRPLVMLMRLMSWHPERFIDIDWLSLAPAEVSPAPLTGSLDDCWEDGLRGTFIFRHTQTHTVINGITVRHTHLSFSFTSLSFISFGAQITLNNSQWVYMCVCFCFLKFSLLIEHFVPGKSGLHQFTSRYVPFSRWCLKRDPGNKNGFHFNFLPF